MCKLRASTISYQMSGWPHAYVIWTATAVAARFAIGTKVILVVHHKIKHILRGVYTHNLDITVAPYASRRKVENPAMCGISRVTSGRGIR